MSLVTFTPEICVDGTLNGCDNLVAYARINQSYGARQQATMQLGTTIFTCFILAIAFIVFSNDTEIIVIRPI